MLAALIGAEGLALHCRMGGDDDIADGSFLYSPATICHGPARCPGHPLITTDGALR